MRQLRYLETLTAGAGDKGTTVRFALPTGCLRRSGMRMANAPFGRGVYPLGMMLVVSWAPARTGEALGRLLGKLTLGTALPQTIRAAGTVAPWQAVVLASSVLAAAGGMMVLALGDEPHLPHAARKRELRFGAILKAFRVPAFRASALGYFGHMWELYAFWTVVLLLVGSLLVQQGAASASHVSAWSFAVIGAGAAGCVLAGRLSRSVGSAAVAALALAGSAACCLVYPSSRTLPRALRARCSSSGASPWSLTRRSSPRSRCAPARQNWSAACLRSRTRSVS